MSTIAYWHISVIV